MKKIRILAVLMAAVMLFSLSGCQPADTSWVVQLGEEKLPSGAYNMFLLSSYSELKNTTGEADPETVIANAKKEAEKILAIRTRFNQLGLTIDPQELAELDKSVSGNYAGLEPMLMANGITKDDALYIYEANPMSQAVFMATYGEGGELEVPRDELLAALEATYTRSQHLMFPKVDALGQPLSEEALGETFAQALDYLVRANQEGQVFSDLVRELDLIQGYNYDYEDYQYDVFIDKNSNSLPPVYMSAVLEAPDNSIQLVEDDYYIFIIYKRPIAESRGEIFDQFLRSYKFEEFAAGLDEWISQQEYVYNEKALSVFTPESLKTTDEQIAEALGEDWSSSSENVSESSS